MRNFFLITILISFISVNAQQISDYKYIIVPKKFQEFDENQYKLNTYLKNLLIKKNYEVLSEDVQQWPVEVQQNSCLAASVDVKKRKNFLKNKVEIVFTDCAQKQIGIVLDGDTSIKEYEKGYQDALKNAVQGIQMQNPNALNKPSQTHVPNTQNTQVTENTNQQTISSASYSNGQISLIKSDLTDGSFLLINESNAQVYAQFFPSSKSGVFHVKVIDNKGNYETIGYFDGTVLEIELSQGGNKWALTQFKKFQ